jgi:hypothetical protein
MSGMVCLNIFVGGIVTMFAWEIQLMAIWFNFFVQENMFY